MTQDDLVALTDPDSLHLGRVGSPDEIWVPDVISADSTEIVFDFTDIVRTVQAPPNLLDRFVASRTDGALIQLATRLGPLALFDSPATASAMPKPKELSGFRYKHREPLLWWREFRQQIHTVLKLVASIRSQVVPTAQDFEELEEVGVRIFNKKSLEASGSLPRHASRRELARSTAVLYTRALAESCELRPALVFRRDNVRLVFQDGIAQGLMGGLSLAGALTVQIMEAIAGAGFALCDGCGEAFAPRRRQPTFGKNRYCQRCGKQGAALREAKKRYRKKLFDKRMREKQQKKGEDR